MGLCSTARGGSLGESQSFLGPGHSANKAGMSFRFRLIGLATVRSIKDWDCGPERAGLLAGGPTGSVSPNKQGPTKGATLASALFLKKQTHQAIESTRQRPKSGQNKPNVGTPFGSWVAALHDSGF